MGRGWGGGEGGGIHNDSKCVFFDAAGGAVLGTSVIGHEEMQEDTPQFQRVANKLRYWGIDMLFVIGGEGGIKMAAEMAQWCNKEQVRGHTGTY